MTSSPKFKITVLGVAQGYHPGRVRAALERRFRLSPDQVEQILANEAPAMLGLLDHQTAWNLKSRLHEVGVNCRISPVPLSNLSDVEVRMSLQALDSDRHVGHPPRVQRASQQAMKMRSGKAPSAVKPPSAKAFPAAALWRVAAVVTLVTMLGWYIQHNSRSPAPVAMAEMGR